MPRKGKYIPSDFSERDKVAKKNSKKALVVVPLYTGISIQDKFCFAGDVTLNLRWFQPGQPTYVEQYDIPFKGQISMKIQKDSGIIESSFYSKTQQLDDKDGKISQIIKVISSLSDIKALQFAEFIKTITYKAEQQRTIGRALVMQNIRLDSLYAQAHKKAMEIIASFDVGEAKIHYSIQKYNFDLHQMEKSSNGMNLNLIDGCGLNPQNIGNVKGGLGRFINDYLYLGYLVDPFNLNEDINELMIHTADGITLKVIIHQKSFSILPCFFYLLKVRLIYFDREDIRKLKVYRQTGELLYPLQFTDFEAEGKDGYFDYSPNYNYNPFLSGSNTNGSNNNNNTNHQENDNKNLLSYCAEQSSSICEQEFLTRPVTILSQLEPQQDSNYKNNQSFMDDSEEGNYRLGSEPFSQFLQPFQSFQQLEQRNFKEMDFFEMSNVSQLIEWHQKEKMKLAGTQLFSGSETNKKSLEMVSFSANIHPENQSQECTKMINHNGNILQSEYLADNQDLEQNKKDFLSRFYQINS